MGLESATYLNQLVTTNPDGADDKSEGDNHLRLLKQVLQNTFPNLGRAVSIQAQSWADKNMLASVKDSNYGMAAADNGGVLYFTCTTGTRNYNLTAFASTPDGFCVFIDRDTGANNLSLVPSGTEQINSGGAGTALVLVAGESGFLYKGTSEWRFIAARLIASSTRPGDVELSTEAEFLAGTDTGRVPPVSVAKKHTREKLYADKNYYVRADGSDSNDGSANDAAHAFRNPVKAWQIARDTLDWNGFNVIVNIADGTYTSQLLVRGRGLGQIGSSSLVFKGNAGTPANVILSTTSQSAVLIDNGGLCTIQDMELRTTTSGNCIESADGSIVEVSNVRFGTCAARHFTAYSGGRIYVNGNYSIVGAATRHFFASAGGYIECSGKTITLSGTPAFSDQFARASNNGVVYTPGNTFSGTGATGQRYNALQGGIIDTEGGGANYFPGNSAGAATSPGGYF